MSKNCLMRLIGLPLFLLLTSQLMAQMPDRLSDTEKLYGLSKFWQEVNYNFVYLSDIDREQWDSSYRQLLGRVASTDTDYEYYRLLQRFCAQLKDGHTNIYLPQTLRDSLYRTHFGQYRLFLSNIGGQAIITRINASKRGEIPLGTAIIEVNGRPTREYMNDEVMPYIAASTDYIRTDRAVSRLLQGPVGKRYRLLLRTPKGVRFSLALTHERCTEKAVYPPFPERELLDFAWQGNDIAYLALNSFSDPDILKRFEAQLSKLRRAKALIIDLRNNGGGNTSVGREIISHLTGDSLLYGFRSYTREHLPAYKAWGQYREASDTVGSPWARKAYLSGRDAYYHAFSYAPDTIGKDGERIVVPTVILTGHRTASAAEDFRIYADNQEHMVRMGRATYVSTGQPFPFDLPGGGSARVCTKKDTYPDGRLFVGVGIQPQIRVEKTVADYIANRDPALDRALRYLIERL